MTLQSTEEALDTIRRYPKIYPVVHKEVRRAQLTRFPYGVRGSYKTAVPHYYQGRVQLLLPLCLTDPQKTDLALAVEIHKDFYRATTCLTLDMAYNNARQLAKPDQDWLTP